MRNKEIYGNYINTNFDNPICCVEAPHKMDTLILMKNGKFKSEFFGEGTYILNNGINPKIELHYIDMDKPAIYRTYFLNKLFDKPKIILNADLNHYYLKK